MGVSPIPQNVQNISSKNTSLTLNENYKIYEFDDNDFVFNAYNELQYKWYKLNFFKVI